MRAASMCIACLLGKQEKLIRDFDGEEKKARYMHEALEILYRYGQSESAPWLSEQLHALYAREWGGVSYEAAKRKYNRLLLEKEAEIERAVRAGGDCLLAGLQYACAGNYIDFSAVENVSEQMLAKLLGEASEMQIPEAEYDGFRRDLAAARRLVYVTDNCGEIVLDKLLIRILKEQYPALAIHVLVRGREVGNDATVQDAQEVGLTELVPCVGNGTGTAGTVLKNLSEEARGLLLDADVILAKGQGNFETMFGEGLNPYYLFLCKCELFVRRFGLKRFEPVFAKEERILAGEKRVLSVVAGLVWNGPRFLACQRPAHKTRGLLWEFAGGKVEPGETPEQALIREWREELAVTLSVGEVFAEVTHEYPDAFVHLTLFHARIAEGTPQRLEHRDIRWILPEEIPQYSFCPADKDILERIMREYGSK